MRIKILIYPILAMSLLTACEPSRPLPANGTSAPASAPTPRLVLTTQENAVLHIVLTDRIASLPSMTFSTERLAPLTGYVVPVNAMKLQSEYERNEASADQQFRHKNVLLGGLVKSVDRGTGDNYYVTLEGGSNSLGNPRAMMESGHLAFLASLDKQQRIGLACKGGGMISGAARLVQCIPIDTYARHQATRFLLETDIHDLFQQKGWLRDQIVLAVGYASELPAANPCTTKAIFNDDCMKLVDSIRSMYADRGDQEPSKRMTMAAVERLSFVGWSGW